MRTVSKSTRARLGKAKKGYYADINKVAKALAKDALKRVQGNTRSAKMALMGAVGIVNEKVKTQEGGEKSVNS